MSHQQADKRTESPSSSPYRWGGAKGRSPQQSRLWGPRISLGDLESGSYATNGHPQAERTGQRFDINPPGSVWACPGNRRYLSLHPNDG